MADTVAVSATLEAPGGDLAGRTAHVDVADLQSLELALRDIRERVHSRGGVVGDELRQLDGEDAGSCGGGASGRSLLRCTGSRYNGGCG